MNDTAMIELYYKKKAQYNKAKKKQVANIRKDELLTKKEKKEKATKLKLPCIFCKKMVGTIFERKKNHLIARCGGNNKSCSDIMKIRIYAYTTSDIIRTDFLKDINELKNNIIELKSKTLLKYIDNQYAVEVFKKLNDDLNVNADIYLHMMRKYNNHFSNINFMDDELQDLITEFEETIKKIKNFFNEYKKSGNESTLTDIANLYENTLKIINDKIRTKKYKNLELISVKDENNYINMLKYNTHLPEDVEEFFDIEDELKTPVSDNSTKEEEDAKKLPVNLDMPEALNVEKPKEKLIVEGDDIFFDNVLILNKRNYNENIEKIKDYQEIKASKAYSNKYVFEMIYTEEERPVLISINPNNGEVFKVLAGE